MTRFSAAAVKRWSASSRYPRARERWLSAGVPEIHQTGSFRTGLVLPGEASDIDLNIPHDGQTEQLRALLEQHGAPFRADHGTHIRHRYATPEGVKVDVNIRPRHHLNYLVGGLDRIAALPEADRNQLLLEKHRAHTSGDAGFYKQWKQDLLERHGAVPAGGDWAKLGADLYRPPGFSNLALNGIVSPR